MEEIKENEYIRTTQGTITRIENTDWRSKSMEEEKLTMSLYRIYKHIEDTIKEHGDISQFKEDVLYVINELLAKPIKVSTATEIVVRNEEGRINKMQREKDEEHIRKLKCKIDDLEKEKARLLRDKAILQSLLEKEE